MPFNIFGKLIAALLSALLFAAPVSPAAAWSEICMKFPVGVGYAGHFHVVHGFEPGSDESMPGRIIARDFMGASSLSPREFRGRMDSIRDDLSKLTLREEGETAAYYERMERKVRSEQDRLTEELAWVPNAIANIRGGNEEQLPASWLAGPIHNAPPGVFSADALPARDAEKSAYIRGGQTRCVSIRHVSRDAPFYVLMNAHGRDAPAYALCGTHSSNPNWWYRNRSSSWTQKLEYSARGDLLSPRCGYSKEY